MKIWRLVFLLFIAACSSATTTTQPIRLGDFERVGLVYSDRVIEDQMEKGFGDTQQEALIPLFFSPNNELMSFDEFKKIAEKESKALSDAAIKAAGVKFYYTQLSTFKRVMQADVAMVKDLDTLKPHSITNKKGNSIFMLNPYSRCKLSNEIVAQGLDVACYSNCYRSSYVYCLGWPGVARAGCIAGIASYCLAACWRN